jgi:acetyl-CoA carboxylase beta subunit
MPSCKDCRWWRPDIFFIYIGDCSKKLSAFDKDNESCNEYEENRVDADFVWCSDCMTTVHKSELSKHRNHVVYCNVHVDYDAHEHISAGD